MSWPRKFAAPEILFASQPLGQQTLSWTQMQQVVEIRMLIGEICRRSGYE